MAPSRLAASSAASVIAGAEEEIDKRGLEAERRRERKRSGTSPGTTLGLRTKLVGAELI